MESTMSDIENLWGSLTEFPDLDLPKAILEAQKSYLEAALGGMVLADVRQSNPSGKIKVSFVVYPSIYEDMDKEILSVSHGIGIYPATVRSSLEPNSEEKAADDASLKQIVGRILSSSEAHHIVNKMRLLSMSK
tara:strand:+ start:4168 stop:4569 length:402 start_codon:yes stop_codon:yes gene_type:complete